MGLGRVLLAYAVGQLFRGFRREVAVMFVGIDAHVEALEVAFGMELGGVDIAADAEHLYRTDRSGCQQRTSRRCFVAGFLVSHKHANACRHSLQQRILAAGVGNADINSAYVFTVSS